MTVKGSNFGSAQTTSPVTFNGVVPGVTSSIASATVVTVTGVGGNGYDLSCVASDFTNLNGASATPTMPVGALACSGRGWVTFPSQPMTTAGRLLDSATGTPFVWRHDYIMDMTLNAPWTNEPGTYQTSVVFTMVAK